MIADVIVDIAASETDRIYSYLCDDTVAEGSRVYAPFGGRVTAGFVVALRDSCDYPAEKLKKVTAADPMPLIRREQGFPRSVEWARPALTGTLPGSGFRLLL